MRKAMLSSPSLAPEIVGLLARKELHDALRNRWFMLYTLVFTLLTLVLSWMGLASGQRYGLVGFGRTTASLINLVMLVVPLMGLTLGALSLAIEREQGTLLYVLAQPITAAEVLLGKLLGLAIALTATLSIGFGLSGLLLAWQGSTVGVGAFIGLLGLSILLSIFSLSLGLLFSGALPRTAAALGSALFAWLLLVFLGDLGLLGSVLVLHMPIEQLFVLSLLNPLQVFKFTAILLLQGDLQVLGPAGQYAMHTYGWHLLPLSIGLLGLWAFLPLLPAYLFFRQRGAL